VISNQIEIEYVSIVHRSRGALAAEISTRQKYPEILCYSGAEMHIRASEYTRKDTYDEDAHASTLIFPRSMRGATLAYSTGRYTMHIALFKRNRHSRHDAAVRRDEDWRVKHILGELEGHDA
jgi:hypothetical protein